jgi:hypothetical protein
LETLKEQLRLDLNDRQQFLLSYIKNRPLYSGQGWYIFRPQGKNFYLGIRTHDMGGTDYDYLEKVSYEEAKWLITLPKVYDFCDCVRKYP